MRIVVASDWHITKKSGLTTDIELLYEFLKVGDNHADLTILNGDVFDLWRVPWKKIINSRYKKGINKKIINKIAEMRQKGKLEYVVGNHDFPLKEELELPLEYHIPESDILVTHGHIWDPFCVGANKKYTKFGIRMLKILEDLTTNSVSDMWMKTMYWLGVKNLQHPHLPEGLDFFEEGRVHIAAFEDLGIKRIIHGHTHRAAISADGVVMNAGCSIDGCTDYLYIEDGVPYLKEMSAGFDYLKRK